MNRLSKVFSSEAYGISPQQSSVRLLRTKMSVNGVYDLKEAKMIVKNSLNTTVNGASKALNISWGQRVEKTATKESSTVQYPGICQVRNATLKYNNQVLQHREHVNVHAVNELQYKYDADLKKKVSNLGYYGFQRLENGPKNTSQNESPVGTLVSYDSSNQHGYYLSPFVDKTIVVDEEEENFVYSATNYKSVHTVIPLVDLFPMVESTELCNLQGDLEVEIQFEDYMNLTTEFETFSADIVIAGGVTYPQPAQGNKTLDLDGANASLTIPDAIAGDFVVKTLSQYKTVLDVPLLVGNVICVWNKRAVPTTISGATPVPDYVGSIPIGCNIFQVTSISIPIGGGVATITMKIFNSGGTLFQVQTSAGPPVVIGNVTLAMVTAYLKNGDNSDVVSLSVIPNPATPTAGTASASTATNVFKITDHGRRLSTYYTIDELALQMVEKVGMTAPSQTIEYIDIVKDFDIIPASQLNYSKSFDLDPNCVGVMLISPPKLDDGDRTLMGLSYVEGVLERLVYRNSIDGAELYNRDIVFSKTSQSHSVLWIQRLEKFAERLNMQLKNLSTVTSLMKHNGITQHFMMVEPIEMKAEQQKLLIRVDHDVNAQARTLYVFKYVIKSVTI